MKKIREYIKEKTNNTTKSIRTKLFLMMTVTIMAIILLLTFINSFVIESYYLHYKKTNLLQSYNKVSKYIISDTLSKNMIGLEIEKIAINNNFNIVVLDKNNNNVYNTNGEFNYMPPDRSKLDKKNLLYNKDDTYIIEMKDNKNGINYLLLVGKLENGYNVHIRMPISSIKDSVKISNNFLYSIGIITIIVSGIAIMIISKKFTKPISELSGIANKMSNLDFSQKYRIKDTEDEIDNLGKSINKMSDKLEQTITKLKQNNSELEKDIERKSKLDEMRKQFISDVSHELKTPISLIQGYSEGLIENVNADEENRKFYAEVIQDEANKMDKMVKELLELMKLEYGAKTLNNTFIDITELIKQNLKKYTMVLEECNINVKFGLEEPVYVYADKDMIEKILNNYINNSIKHTETIKNERYIKIIIKKVNDKIRISVFNTGKNINEENLSKIWNRFYKEDTSRNREIGGTGIGLSLVKAIMNNYNNEYGVLNKENGVEFYFDLNINKV